MSEQQLSERVEELKSTIHQLQAECNLQSSASRDCSADVAESDIVRDLTAEKVSTEFRLVSRHLDFLASQYRSLLSG